MLEFLKFNKETRLLRPADMMHGCSQLLSTLFKDKIVYLYYIDTLNFVKTFWPHLIS